MDTPHPTALAWCVPEACLSLADAQRILAPMGLVPIPYVPAEPYENPSELLVLYTAAAGSLDGLVHALERLAKPGLVVVDSETEETQVLAWGLPPELDICRAGVLAAQLGHRLQRVLTGLRLGFGGGLDTTLGPVQHKQIHNRGYLDARLPREFDSARKHCRSLTLAWINLTRLDTLAKTEGEAVVRQWIAHFGRIVFANIRITDWLARYSRDEFCLVMPDTWLEEGRGVAARIERALETARLQADAAAAPAPGISIGVAELTDHEAGFEDLIHAAAEAALMETLLARPTR